MALQPVPKEDLSSVRHIDLGSQPGNFHRVDIRVPDPNNENSCLLSYYEYGRDQGTDGGKNGLLN